MRRHVLRRLTAPSLLLAALSFTMAAKESSIHRIRSGAKTPPAKLAKPDVAAQARLSAAFGKLPLSFEANQGQADAGVQFLSRGNGYSLFLTSTESVLALTRGTKDSRELVQAQRGQAARVAGHPLLHSAHLAQHSALSTPHSTVLRMRLVGANPTARVMGLEELPGKANYFQGNDPKQWRTNVTTYARVKYQNVYPGIDLVYYGQQRQLEYDFVVTAGADPKTIRMSFEGVDKLEVNAEGDLVLHTAAGELVQHAPTIYQVIQGTKQNISGRYELLEAQSPVPNLEPAPGSVQQIGFEVSEYDPRRALVIDPVLAYSTYLGGSGIDNGVGIAVDPAGNAYVTGSTFVMESPTANDFPTTPGAFQTTYAGNSDAFVAKLNAAGTALVYSTYMGGSSVEFSHGIAVDSAGNAYVTGETESTDFPTANPLQPVNGGQRDAFVAKLNAAGSALAYSTYLGGSDYDGSRGGIAVDSAGSAYVTGLTGSTDFPTINAVQPALGGFADAFVTKLNAAGTELVYSTYLGGSSFEGAMYGGGIAVDSAGSAYVTGLTGSTDFPTANALQPALGGFEDAFVAKLNAAGTALVYSTYLGGSGFEEGYHVAADSAGNAYVTGFTTSTDFPTANAFQPAIGGFPCGEFGCPSDAFLTKLNAAGTALVYSTYLGGSAGDGGWGIAVDSTGTAYLTGDTGSADFPTANALQPTFGGGTCGIEPFTFPCPDEFVAKLDAAGSALVYSTYLGGSGFEFQPDIAVDSAGDAYVIGTTSSNEFPTKNPLQPVHHGGFYDAFVAKIATGPSAVHIDIDIKPGSPLNSINPRSNGNVPVAILTAKSFDASSVDPSAVHFGRTGEETAPLRSSLEDVDADGDTDLILHFSTQATSIVCGDSSARLTGKTFDGQPVEGADSLRTVGCH